MDDNAKILSQNINPVVQGNPTQPQDVTQPVGQSTGSLNKETETIGVGASQLSEINPAGIEAEHNLSQELKDIGVEEKKDRPDLTEEHRQTGIDHAGPHVPVSAASANSIQYPMSEEEITEKLKTGQDDDSGKWLAGLIQKILKVMGL